MSKKWVTSVLKVSLIICLLFFGCKKKPTQPTPTPTSIQLSLNTLSGPPGSKIEATASGLELSSPNAVIMFDSIPAPIFVTDSSSFWFLTPMTSSGQYKVFIKDKQQRVSNQIDFTVTDPPNTGVPLGEIVTEMITSTDVLVDAVLDAGGRLTEMGLFSGSDSLILAQDLQRIKNLLSAIENEFASLPDSVKLSLDAFIYSAGISELLEFSGGGLSIKQCLSELNRALAVEAQYDTFYVLIALDNLSLALSELKAGLTISSIAALIATGGIGAPASTVLASLSFSIALLDNIIDGALPTDLDRLNVSFIPQVGPELNVGEKASVVIKGYFGTQKDPVDATVDIIISGLFFGIQVQLADELSGVLEQLSLKIGNAMMVSLDDIIINSEPVSLPNPVSVDIGYYENDLPGMFTVVGLSSIFSNVLIALTVVDLFLPDFYTTPLSFNTDIISYDPVNKEITAIKTGILGANNVTSNAWANKPLCNGLFSFLCLGIEWPKVIDYQKHTVTNIEIIGADLTPPAPITDLAASNPTSNSINLTWTAPGDDGNSGTASQYDIRYSTSNITETNWGDATQCTGEPTPKSAGNSESFVVTGLNPNTTYYFAVKTADEVPNWSLISNVPSTTTTSAGTIQFVGSYDTPDDAHGVFVSGNYAYVADGSSGLQIINIANPSSPTLAGSYDTPGFAGRVFVSGSYAYVADGSSGLQIINITNPSSPTLAGSFGAEGAAVDVHVSGNYAYMADIIVPWYSILWIIDISNPSSPTRAGAYEALNWPDGIFVSGNYAYVADAYSGSSELQIIDISNPSSPTLVGSYDTPDNPVEVFVSGNYAYLLNSGPPGLEVINITNPSNPTLVASYSPSWDAGEVFVSGGYIYVAAGSGLQILKFVP